MYFLVALITKIDFMLAQDVEKHGVGHVVRSIADNIQTLLQVKKPQTQKIITILNAVRPKMDSKKKIIALEDIADIVEKDGNMGLKTSIFLYIEETMAHLYDTIDTNYFTDCINANMPVRFIKWGDGEYSCASGGQGDKYFPDLGKGLQSAFVNLVSKSNTYFGRWHLGPNDAHVSAYFNTFWKPDEIPWVNYHCLLRDAERGKKKDMLHFVKAIRDNKRKKIYVCNAQNARLCQVFGAEHVEIPPNCWYLFYDNIMAEIQSRLTPDCIVLFSAGLCAKVAISELVESNPSITCLDVGSSFDCLARGTPSRSYQGSFMSEVAYYAEVLPAEWVLSTHSSH